MGERPRRSGERRARIASRSIAASDERFGQQWDAVLEAARQAAPWALEALYRHFHPRLIAYLRSQDAAEFEDLASQTWIDVAAGLARFSGDEDACRRFVFAIARRRLVDLRRSRSRRRTDVTSPETLDIRPHQDDPAATAVEGITSETALRFLRSVLPSDQAEIVSLRVVGGLDVAAVAELVGRRPGTVRVLQHRALRRLAEVFSDPCNAWARLSDVDG